MLCHPLRATHQIPPRTLAHTPLWRRLEGESDSFGSSLKERDAHFPALQVPQSLQVTLLEPPHFVSEMETHSSLPLVRAEDRLGPVLGNSHKPLAEHLSCHLLEAGEGLEGRRLMGLSYSLCITLKGSVWFQSMASLWVLLEYLFPVV